jgi:hypothetical protein
MQGALATVMLNAVGLSLALLGMLGACLASWQLLGFAVGGAAPAVAEVWRHSGLMGELLVALFAWLPQVLGIAIAFHFALAWLGTGLLWRRRWAWTGGLVFASLWVCAALGGWAVAHYALTDLARGYPERAGFAHAVQPLAAEVAVVNALLGVALAALLLQRVVRQQFRIGSWGTSR